MCCVFTKGHLAWKLQVYIVALNMLKTTGETSAVIHWVRVMNLGNYPAQAKERLFADIYYLISLIIAFYYGITNQENSILCQTDGGFHPQLPRNL